MRGRGATSCFWRERMAVVLNSLSPAEIEFLAENELVTIDPNVNLDQLHFISVRKGARERGSERETW